MHIDQNPKICRDKSLYSSIGGQFPHLIRYFEKDIAKTWPKQYFAQYFKDKHIPPNPKGVVYKMAYYDTATPKLVISLTGNNYCLNVGRCHKKNNIFFVIDIPKFTFRQRCHDDMCDKFNSPEIYLPPELFFSTKQDRLNFT